MRTSAVRIPGSARHRAGDRRIMTPSTSMAACRPDAMIPTLSPFAALTAFADYWRWTARLQQAWATGLQSPGPIARLRTQRLQDLIEHAQAHSPLYRSLYGAGRVVAADLVQLPAVDKQALMAGFDDWVTDPGLRRDEIERFVADPARIGEPYHGRYAVWTSSGSTGRPGLYVQDENALAVYDALLAARFPRAMHAGSPFQTLAAGGRFAMVAATGGHFAGVVSWERLRREFPWMASAMRTFPVLAPLRELVAQLDAWPPTILASYPTTLLLLARERAAGRLGIRPRVLWSGGETLAPAERAEIAAAFDAEVIDGYGASECLQIAFDCGHGSLHLNSDWVILEAVDEHGRPVPDGVRSASCLLTNLANRVQPLIRYDLGDSITYRAGGCRCGSPFPALSVDGRRDDILLLASADGSTVPLAPLAVATVVEERGGAHRFQVIQAGPRALDVRFETPDGVARGEAWQRIVRALRDWLASHGLRGIVIREDPTPPRPDPVSGKLREVLGARTAGHARRSPRTRRQEIRSDDDCH